MELEGLAICNFQDVKSTNIPDPTAKMALRALNLREKMEMVEKTAEKIDISKEIFVAVTKEKAYPYFEALGCPFGRDLFYDRLRKFYYLLDKIRN